VLASSVAIRFEKEVGIAQRKTKRHQTQKMTRVLTPLEKFYLFYNFLTGMHLYMGMVYAEWMAEQCDLI